MLGVTFGNKHSYNDWGIWLEDTHINPPLPKRYIVDVPARNGLLDLTPELTPTIRFENRTLTFNFRVKAGDWSTLVSQIYGDIHGRTLDVVSDLDPQWHWHGCVTVDDFSSDERTGKLVITVDADPFKLSNTENSYTINGNGTITCEVDRMEISPAFEIEAPTTVIYGDSSYTIESTATTEKTLSGDIVSFADGTANPAVDLTVDIEAVQDLHGYDNPWVGGAGKNKLEVTGTTTTMQGITFNVSQDGTITVSGTFQTQVNFLINGTCYLKAGDYILSGIPSAPSWTTFQMYITVNGNKYASVNGTQFTVDTDGKYPVYLSIYGAVSGTLTFKPMIRLASISDATFEPYTNICPISGWDEVNVNRIGKNWCNKNGDLVLGFWITSGGVPSITANTSNIAFNYKIPIPKGEALTLSANTSINNFGYCTFQADGTYINRIDNNNTSSVTIASTTFDRYVLVWVNRNNVAFSSLNSAREWLLSAEIQFEYSTQRTEFVSDGQTYTTDLDGTRYGGTLDVTTGVLTITHGGVDLSTLSWGYQTGSPDYFYSYISNKAYGNFNIIADCYKTTTSTSVTGMGNGEIKGNGGNANIYVKDSRYTDATAITQSLSGHYAVYPLATPQVVQLTAEQVMILKNQNNIWADSGEVEVTYLAQDFAGKKFYIPDLELTEGSHELTIQGTGTTTVTYTNGRL